MTEERTPQVQGYWKPVWQKFRRSGFAMAGLAVCAALALMALVSAFRALPHDPYEQDLEQIVQPVSGSHWFGTDDLGRDLFSRIMYGSLISLKVGVGAILISLVIGLALGTAAAWLGGWYDHILMRITDIFLAMPTVLFAMAMLAVFEPSMKMLVSVLGFLGWPGMARIIRSQILTVREEDYVTAARAAGIRSLPLVLRHVLPNAMAPLMVAVTIGVAGNILAEAWLSFLGIGVPPPEPSWGRMINEGQAYISTRPWLCIFPGMAIFITVLAFNLLGDGLRDSLDPKNR